MEDGWFIVREGVGGWIVLVGEGERQGKGCLEFIGEGED